MSTVTSLGFSIYSTYNNKGIKNAQKDVTSLGSKVGGMAKSIGSIAMKAAVPIVLIAAESVRSAVKFESSMKKIQTQAGATAGDVKTLSKQVLALAPSTQQGPEKLSEALYHLKSVGMDNVDAMKSLKVASDLAAVGGADLESTTNALAGAWRTGIKGATSFAQSAATVNAIIGAGNMTMEDMVSALGTGILPTAKTFGLTFSSVGAALAVFTDEGVGAASAATRLRMTISLLGAPSKAASKVLKTIGLTGTELANEMRSPRGLVGAVGLLKSKMDAAGLSATKQAQLLSMAFGGGKSSSAIMSLVNNYDVLQKKQNQVNASMGKYGPAVAAQRKTAQAQFNLLKSAVETMSIELGNKLLPPVTSFAEWIVQVGLPAAGKFKDAIGDMIPVDTIKSKIGQVEDLLSNALKSTGVDKLIDKLSPTTKKTTKYQSYHLPTYPVRPTIQPGTTKAQAEAITKTLNPIKTFKSGEGSGAKALASAGKANPGGIMQTGENLSLTQAKKLTNAKGPSVKNQLSKTITDAISGLDAKTVGKVLGHILGVAFMFAMSGIADLGKMITDVAKKVDWVNVGKSIGGNAIGFALGFLASLGTDLFSASFWKKHWLDAIIGVLSLVGIGKIAGPLAKVFEHIPILKVIAPLLKSIGDIGKPFAKAFDVIWKPLKKAFVDGFEKEIPGAKGALGRFIGTVLKNIDGWGATIYLKALYAIEGVGRAMGGGSAKAIIAVGKFFKDILGVFPAAVILMATAGRSLSEGILNGIVSLFTGIGKWIDKHIFKPFMDSIDSLFEMHSPSKVMFTRGVFIISGMLNGILNAIAGVGKWLSKHVVIPIKNAFSSAGSWLYSKGRSIVNGLTSGIANVASGLSTWIGKHVKNPTTAVFKSAGTWIKSKGSDVINGFFDGLKAPWSDVQKWVSGVAKWIKKHKGPIELDRRLLHPAGVALMQGLLKGLKVGFKHVGSFIHNVGTTIADTTGKIPLDDLGKIITSDGGPSNRGYDAKAAGKAQSFAKGILGNYNWGSKEFGPLKSLWNQESGWSYTATNPTSGAYGIPQSLPASKMASAGKDWRTNYKTQILWGLDYIRSRYGTPAEAWDHEKAHNWYANGTPGASAGYAWVGERGPELMKMRGGERIIANHDIGGGGGDNYYDLRGAIISSKKDFEDMVVAANRNIKRKGRG